MNFHKIEKWKKMFISNKTNEPKLDFLSFFLRRWKKIIIKEFSFDSQINRVNYFKTIMMMMTVVAHKIWFEFLSIKIISFTNRNSSTSWTFLLIEKNKRYILIVQTHDYYYVVILAKWPLAQIISHHYCRDDQIKKIAWQTANKNNQRYWSFAHTEKKKQEQKKQINQMISR